MRREIPVLANIFPAGEKTCDNCKSVNLLGEGFHTNFKLFAKNETLCPDCYKVAKSIEKEKERQRYVDGDDNPTSTDEIVCPWCGSEQDDSWEAPDSDDECECDVCGKMYAYERVIEITYTSYRVEGEE